jgi:porin
MRAVVFILVCFLTSSMMVQAQEAKADRRGKAGYEKKATFGGPTSTSAQLEEADEVTTPIFRLPFVDGLLQPYFDAKAGLDDDHGLRVGAAYNVLYQQMSDVPDGAVDEAATGIIRVFGRWELMGRGTPDTGTLVFSGDNRHRFTDIAPSDLGFQGGYLGIPGTLYSDADTVLVDFNWQQIFNNGKSGLVVGRFDPNDFFDVLGYANPWTTFSNLAVLFNTSIALPDASMGIGAGHWFSEQCYGKATLNDANGVVSDIGFFEGGSEFYKAVETGWTPAQDQVYFKKFNVMAWHADEREDAGVEESYGVTASANWTFNDTWMPFAKVGISDGTSPINNESVTLGGIYYLPERSDLLGAAANWGDPADSSLGDQFSFELFYRVQLAQNLAITPSVQLILDPALNPDEEEAWIGGIRARLTL